MIYLHYSLLYQHATKPDSEKDGVTTYHYKHLLVVLCDPYDFERAMYWLCDIR